MESRLEKVESKLGDIREDQSAIKESLATMGKTLNVLANVRSETLYLMKQREQDTRDHDEIFSRLRKVENGRTSCDEKHITVKESIGDVKSSQRKIVFFVLCTIIAYVFKGFIV